MSATISVNGSTIGTALTQLLIAPDIEVGSTPSYELCKQIYAFHPLGAKIVEAPIEVAMSQPRKVAVACPGTPEERVRDAFIAQWEADGADGHIGNTAGTARIYGIASVACLTDGKDPDAPLDFETLWRDKIAFNVFDPLNTAGSLVLNQDPNSLDFQKHASIAVAGKKYARNRSATILNEKPLYIEYTPSAFGFSGRSVYQRILLPLKSFVQTMVTDDMVSKKAGLIIAFIKGAGSFVDNLMQKFAGMKRSLLKIAVVDNVLSMGSEDSVESLNLQNLDGAFGNSRTNILKNIATGAKMPAVMLENETLTEGFGEGTEDAKVIAQFVKGVRAWMKPLYDFFDPIIQRRAWNPDFFKALKAEFPEAFKGIEYQEAFYKWQKAFSATWPPLLEEPESEKIKVEDVKFKGLLAAVEVLGPLLDPANKVVIVEWVADNLNENKLLFGSPLNLDFDELLAFLEEAAAKAEADAAKLNTEEPGNAGGVRERLDSYSAAIAQLPLARATRKVG